MTRIKYWVKINKVFVFRNIFFISGPRARHYNEFAGETLVFCNCLFLFLFFTNFIFFASSYVTLISPAGGYSVIRTGEKFTWYSKKVISIAGIYISMPLVAYEVVSLLRATGLRLIVVGVIFFSERRTLGAIST